MKQRLIVMVVAALWLLAGCSGQTDIEWASQEDKASPAPKTTAAQEETTQEKTDAQKKAKPSSKAAAKADASG